MTLYPEDNNSLAVIPLVSIFIPSYLNISLMQSLLPAYYLTTTTSIEFVIKEADTPLNTDD